MKKIFIALIGFVITFSLVSCEELCDPSVNVSNSENIASDRFGQFITIYGDLVYDAATRIVYIESSTYYGYETYTPYYAPNGLPYRYNPVTNTLEEIDNG
jgi:hypothetical protein